MPIRSTDRITYFVLSRQGADRHGVCPYMRANARIGRGADRHRGRPYMRANARIGRDADRHRGRPYMRANARFGFIFSYADLTLHSNKDFSGECDCATEHNPLISSRYELVRALPAMCLRRSQYRNAHKILWPTVSEGILSETISSPVLKTYFLHRRQHR